MGILKKIQSAAHNRTTYRVGLLQAKAYRLLKEETSIALKQYSISTVEWAFLGLLYDMKTLRPKVAADELGVEASFVTVMFNTLDKEGLVSQKADPSDSRAKTLFLTNKGNEFVEKVEPVVRAHMRPLVSGSSVSDLLGYLAILQTIIKNKSQKKNTAKDKKTH
jgi:MarR family 2-MHQ and catechol resistance regulon transcriptional repressor